MQISTRTEYALRALLELLKVEDTPLSAQKICERQQLPKKYIERLLGNLKSAGVIDSLSGVKGGYILAKAPAEITLLSVMQAVEDHSWEMSCVSNPPDHCMGQGCSLHGVWKDVYSRIKHILADYSLQTIADMQTQNIKTTEGN
jgi:Rrf2 family protein